MIVIIIPFLLMAVNAAGQGSESTADERARRAAAAGKSTQARRR